MSKDQKKPVTPKEKQVFDFVKKYIAENNISPSQVQIGAALGKSSQTVAHQVDKLVEKGWLTKGAGPYTIEVAA